MGVGDLVPITDADGLTVWVHEPPGQCPNGHPWTAAGGAYRQGWFSCWCDCARARHPARPGHLQFMCKTCGAVVLVPACSDTTAKTGWAASHSH